MQQITRPERESVLFTWRYMEMLFVLKFIIIWVSWYIRDKAHYTWFVSFMLHSDVK